MQRSRFRAPKSPKPCSYTLLSPCGGVISLPPNTLCSKSANKIPQPIPTRSPIHNPRTTFCSRVI